MEKRRLEIAMPTYQYRCDKCGKKFERSETISERDPKRVPFFAISIC